MQLGLRFRNRRQTTDDRPQRTDHRRQTTEIPDFRLVRHSFLDRRSPSERRSAGRALAEADAGRRMQDTGCRIQDVGSWNLMKNSDTVFIYF